MVVTAVVVIGEGTCRRRDLIGLFEIVHVCCKVFDEVPTENVVSVFVDMQMQMENGKCMLIEMEGNEESGALWKKSAKK